MSLPSLHYRVVGEEDYLFDIAIDQSGCYRIDSGDHSIHNPRLGQLDDALREDLQRLLSALGSPGEHRAPRDAQPGFVAELIVGEPSDARRYRFWEGELGQEPELEALVRALEVI